MNWLKGLFYFSGIGLIPILLSYSFCQDKILPILYGFNAPKRVKHILKAMSGLYFGNILIFFLTPMGIIPYEVGLVVLFIFMSGLAFGRLISFVIDGERRFIFILYFLLEVILAGLALWGFNFI